MPGSITPLPVVQELDAEDRKRYEAMQPPKSIVCRYGYLRLVAELPYDGAERPGCGSKLVVRTSRGIELAEMLTTTCGNAGCGKSITRKQMLQYIEASGGKNYPFTTEGKVLRLATPDDIQEQNRLDGRKRDIIKATKALVAELDLPMKLVDVELLLGGERILFHYTSEQWVDFRELVKRLATEFQTRIEMHQVNARDEARIVADYEKCGQHCCCRQFLKVLKPVSMRSAKVQKATLDPTKISGRCGRLMCCLRYEDETYESLRKKLPHKQTRVLTADGAGTIIDSQILTQLVFVRLDSTEAAQAYPLENVEILAKDHPFAKRPEPPRPPEGRDRPDARTRPDQRPDRRGPDPRRAGEGRPAGEPRRDEPRPSGAGAARPANDSRPAGGPGEGRPAGEPRRDEPRRPRPGQPLDPAEIESADGEPADADAGRIVDWDSGVDPDGPDVPPPAASDARAPDAAAPRPDLPPADPAAPAPSDQADEADDRADADGPDDPDAASAPPAPGGPPDSPRDGPAGGPPGEGGKRKRRRRRRRRGRGPGGPPGSTPGAGGPPPPA